MTVLQCGEEAPVVFVAGFEAAAFGTNCWILATRPGEQCVVVDPGVGVVEPLQELLREHRLQPVAVVLTHGHLDHTFSVTPVCGDYGIPAYISGADAGALADPLSWMSSQTRDAMSATLQWVEPDDVRPLADGVVLDLAGLAITVTSTPGHTAGSVVYGLAEGGDATQGAPLALTGDTLFAGAIGRTDLRSGSAAAMRSSLLTKILPLPDATVVLPGHGPTSTMRAERAGNPYLLDLLDDYQAG